MLSKNAIGNLINRYKAVLKKCTLLNVFGSLSVAGLVIAGTSIHAKAAEISEHKQLVGDQTFTTTEGDVYRDIDNCSYGAAFEVTDTATLNVSGNTFQNNKATEWGGAIQNNATVTLKNTNVFYQNSAEYGGALDNYINGTTIFESAGINKFIKNSATSGGAITNDQGGTITFSSNTTNEFTENNASASGGAVENSSLLEFQGSTVFTGNYSNSTEGGLVAGGAVFNNGSGIITFADTVEFSNNYTKSTGTAYSGALGNYGSIAFQKDVSFAGNYSVSSGTDDASGGAISNASGGNIIFSKNAEFSNNYVTSEGKAYGGAIENSETITFQGETVFSGNYAKAGKNYTALGGAIFNEATDTTAGTINFYGKTTFSDNYVQVGNVKTPNDIYNTGTINIGKDADNTAHVTINSGYVGVSDTVNIRTGSTLTINAKSSSSGENAAWNNAGNLYISESTSLKNFTQTDGLLEIADDKILTLSGTNRFNGGEINNLTDRIEEGGGASIIIADGVTEINPGVMYWEESNSKLEINAGAELIIRSDNELYGFLVNNGTMTVDGATFPIVSEDVYSGSGSIIVKGNADTKTSGILSITAENTIPGTVFLSAVKADNKWYIGKLDIKANASINAVRTVLPATDTELIEYTISMDNEKEVSMNSITVAEGTSLSIIGGGEESTKNEMVTVKKVTVADNTKLVISNGAMLNAGNGTVKMGANSDLYVGKSTDTTDSILLAKYLDLAEGAELIVDPQWGTEYPGLALVANIGTTEDSEKINLSSGNILVGSNSVLMLGSTDSETELEKASVFGIGSLNKNTAPVLIALTKKLNVSGNSVVMVDGYKNDAALKSAAATAPAGSLIIGENALVLADADSLGTTANQALIKANSLSVGSNSKLFLTDVRGVGKYYIAKAEDVSIASSAWKGDNLYLDNKLLKATFYRKGNTLYLTTESNVLSALPKLDQSLLHAVDQLITMDADPDSANYATRFIVRAAKWQNADAAAATIEGAAKIAFVGAVPQMNLDLAQRMNTALASRDFLSSTPGAGVDAGNTDNGFALWALPTYQYSRGLSFKSGNFRSGYDSNVGGLALGADYTLNNSLRLGIAVNGGGGRVESNGDFNETKNDVNYIGVNAYTSWKCNNFSLFGQIGWLRTDNDLSQKTPSAMKMSDSKADTDSNVFTVGLRASYQIVTDFLELIPYVELDYYHVHSSGFTVKNSGQDMFHNGTIESDFLQIPVGVNMKKVLTEADGWNVKASLDLAVIPTIGNPTASQDVRIQGLSYNASVNHVITDKVTGRGIIGIEAKKGNFGVGLNYNFQGGSHTVNHGVQAMISWKF